MPFSIDISTPPENKTLTPQRKHRKLLKDGSGSEVWPESIEKVFVDGLHQYWESPWATYSRGRSRWRNQFLVDYLQKRGIERSKKQVASHIQVLRNMWKGEPEFHLVAGGEELFLESGLLAPVKLEDHTSTLIALDGDDNGHLSSTSPSPPQNASSELPHPKSPAQALSPIFSDDPYSTNHLKSFPTELPRSHPSPPGVQNTLYSSPQLRTGFAPSDFSMDRQAVQHAGSDGAASLNPDFGVTSYPPLTQTQPTADFFNDFISAPVSKHSNKNSICGVSLWAEGMLPFTIAIEALSTTNQLSRVSVPPVLRTKLSIPSLNDIHSPPTLQGFSAKITLASLWMSSAKCNTKVYSGSLCISEELESLQISTPMMGGPAAAFIPDSALSRCRWLDTTLQTSITQEIIVDGETLTYIIYDLEGGNYGSLPSAKLVAFQNCRAFFNSLSATSPAPPAAPSFPQTFSIASGYYPNSYASNRCTTQTSLSCALTPVSRRPMVTSSMSF